MQYNIVGCAATAAEFYSWLSNFDSNFGMVAKAKETAKGRKRARTSAASASGGGARGESG